MKHENRKRLETNQKTALNLTSNVIEGKATPIKPVGIKAISREDFSVESLTNLAHNLDIHRDTARNITRYETIGEDGTPHVVRDARQYQTSLSADELNTDKDSIYMQIISSTRAAKQMLNEQGEVIKAGLINTVKSEERQEGFTAKLKSAISSHTQNVR